MKQKDHGHCITPVYPWVAISPGATQSTAGRAALVAVSVTAMVWQNCFWPDQEEKNKEKKPVSGSNIYINTTASGRAIKTTKKTFLVHFMPSSLAIPLCVWIMGKEWKCIACEIPPGMVVIVRGCSALVLHSTYQTKLTWAMVNHFLQLCPSSWATYTWLTGSAPDLVNKKYHLK